MRFPSLIPAIKNTWTLATTVQPETFTELYFENHTQLPNSIEPNKTYNFSFTLHNLEYRDMNYPYEVYIDADGTKQMLDQNTVFVKNAGYKTIAESFTPTVPMGRVKIVANLINKNQQISFWVDGGAKTTPSAIAFEKTEQTQPTPTQTVQPKQQPQQKAYTKPTLPEIFTEMYFDNIIPLPLRVSLNQTANFAFTIHNSKQQDAVYVYQVYLEENGQRTMIDSNQFILKANEYKTTTEAYTVTRPIGLAKVYVSITNENKYIYFEMKGNE